jgi:hypothetical protein
VSLIEMDEFGAVGGLYEIPSDTQVFTMPLRAKPIETPAPVIEPIIKPSQEFKKREERNESIG